VYIHIFYCFIDSGNVPKVKIKRSLGGAARVLVNTLLLLT
jgi:hypothetical protein